MIPVTDANRHIAALNRIAEGVTMLAAAIEESTWEGFEDHAGMLGTRPIAAAQLAQPPLEKATNGSEATPTPEPVSDPKSASSVQPVSDPEPASAVEPVQAPGAGSGSVSLARVRGVLADLSSQGLTERVRELIEATGADRLSDVDPAKYGWLLTQAKELSDAK